MNGNREYRSSMFSLLFNNKENALDVYNGLNDSHFENPEDVEIITGDGGISLSVRNDASFLIGTDMNFYEHQSTYNPNMPLRNLIYCTDAIDRRIKANKQNLYGHKQIKIPTPKFVVFYNGKEKRPAVEKMHLSSSYMGKKENGDLELTCTVYNLNAPENRELLKKSRVLAGYNYFVNKVTSGRESGLELDQAVDEAMAECMEDGILKEFFQTYKNEVRRIMALDFTFERQIELTKLEYYQDGYADGEANGEERGLTQGKNQGEQTKLIFMVVKKLRKGKNADQIAEELEEDIATIEAICEAAEEFAPEYDTEQIYQKLVNR